MLSVLDAFFFLQCLHLTVYLSLLNPILGQGVSVWCNGDTVLSLAGSDHVSNWRWSQHYLKETS